MCKRLKKIKVAQSDFITYLNIFIQKKQDASIKWRILFLTVSLKKSLFLKHSNGFILFALHNLALAFTFIVYSAQMQNTVYNHSVQLLLILHTQLFAVTEHCIEAYKKVARYDILLGVIECNNIGVIIVLKILAINLENFLVVTEDIRNIPNLFTVTCRHLFNPRRNVAALYCGHLNPIGLIAYHISKYNIVSTSILIGYFHLDTLFSRF